MAKTNPINKKFSNGTNKLPKQERLHELLHYQPETGDLFWKINKGPVIAGTMVAPVPNSEGYKLVNIDGVSYRQNRIIYKMMTGRDPGLMLVDHKDGDKLNNRWSNLRLATPGQSRKNTIGYAKSGYKGVYLRPSGNYLAQIRVDKKDKSLGTYPTAEEAHSAYCKAAELLHGEFINTSHKSDQKNLENGTHFE